MSTEMAHSRLKTLTRWLTRREHWFAKKGQEAQKQRGRWILSGLISLGSALSMIWSPNWLVSWLFYCCFLPSIGYLFWGFFLVSSNFRSLHDKIEERLAERLDHDIAQLAASLAQANMNVASLNIQVDSVNLVPVVPEHVLREIDQGLRIKDTMSSLEKVMQTRQRNVQGRLRHIKEQQQKARQAVTAMAGGIFVGYFTYEAGEAVLKFMHIKTNTDDRELLYFLHTGDKRTTSCGEKTHEECTPRKYYDNTFYKSEVIGQGVLLTATLIVTLLAAWLGWRKPTEEHVGGHGGHH